MLPTVVNPQLEWTHPKWTFALAQVVGSTAFLSGHTGANWDPVAKQITYREGMKAQARDAWAKCFEVLEAGGWTANDVIRVVEYVSFAGLDQHDQLVDVRAEVLGADARPAVNTIAVQQLVRPEALVEIELTVSTDAEPINVASTGELGHAPARAADGFVHLSTMLPIDRDGNVAHLDDLSRQTEQIYRNAARALAPFGMTVGDVVKTVEMVRPEVRATYPRTGFIRRAHLEAPYGGGTGIVMDRLAHPDALMQVDFLASTHPREAVDCGWERYSRLTYNPGLKVGKLFVMSGQAALDVETEEAVLPGDIVAQADYTYRNILKVLAAAGGGPEHLVRTVEYVCPDGLDDYGGVAEVRRELFGDAKPAATGVVCSGLLRPEFLIEVDPMAVLP